MRIPTLGRALGGVVSAVAIVLATGAPVGAASDGDAPDEVEANVATPVPVTINGGGGVLADGSDGMRLIVDFNSFGGSASDGQYIRNKSQWCCGPTSTGGGPTLAVGTASVGNGTIGAAGNNEWDDIAIVSTSGTASTAGGSATGSGTAMLRYSETIGGRLYVVDRTVSYTFPNDFVVDRYDVTIPAGNTDAVKLYYGGDTQPGGSDQGYGIEFTTPRRSIISLNTSTQEMYGFRELVGAVPFAGARSETLGNFGTSANTAHTGGDVGFNVEAANHDASLIVQWNLGSTPGVVTAGMEVFATPQGVTVTAAFRDGAGAPNVEELLDFTIGNTNLTAQNGVGFAFALPAGLTLGSTSPVNSCGGTVTAASGGSSIAISGVDLASASNCVLTVPVNAAGGGTYTINSASVTSTTGLTNGVGTASLVISGPPAPPATPPVTPPVTGVAPGIEPKRLVDSRQTKDPIDVGVVREIQIAGAGGVPADATAVTINLTVLDSLGAGYITVYPCGEPIPASSSINFSPGQTVSNSVTIGLGTGGKLCAVSTTPANMIVDVLAVFGPNGSVTRFVQLAPARAADTRGGAKPAVGSVLEVALAGQHGVPADADSAVLNLTITDSEGDGYATVYPCGTSLPPSSNVNFTSGSEVPNSAIVKIGTAGKVCIVTSVPAHVIVDVNGAFSPTVGDSEFRAQSPARLLDTRPEQAKGGTSTVVTLPSALANAKGIAVNVTVDGPAAAGYATVYPCGGQPPLASNLNFAAGQTVANAAISAVGADAKVCVFTTADTRLIVDVTGAFVPVT